MENQNISDLIEEYLKQVLANAEKVEIRRAEMANQFNCVPSQINYVINTRFTLPKGYLVESKRGGGGYIRIMKVHLSNYDELSMLTKEVIGEALSEKDAASILQKLYEDGLLTKREGRLIYSLLQKNVLEDGLHGDKLRAKMMERLIQHLGYEEE